MSNVQERRLQWGCKAPSLSAFSLSREVIARLIRSEIISMGSCRKVTRFTSCPEL